MPAYVVLKGKGDFATYDIEYDDFTFRVLVKIDNKGNIISTELDYTDDTPSDGEIERYIKNYINDMDYDD